MRCYYLMHKDFATPLTSKYPKAAQYDKDTIILTGEIPKGFTGDIVKLCDEELTSNELTIRIDALRNETHTGKLVILSKAQGKDLHTNHEAFKPKIIK